MLFLLRASHIASSPQESVELLTMGTDSPPDFDVDVLVSISLLFLLFLVFPLPHLPPHFMCLPSELQFSTLPWDWKFPAYCSSGVSWICRVSSGKA